MDRLSKKSRDVKKSSKVEKTKKCETSEQRAKRYSPFKTSCCWGTACHNWHDRCDAWQMLLQHSNSLPERYAPSAKDMEQTKKLVKEIENPSTPFRFGPKDAQRGETSQSSMDKNKGKKQLSSKDIANLRTLMEKAKEDPETRQRVRQILEHRQLDYVPPQTPCLSVDNTQIISNVVDATDIPGREMRTLEYLRVKNNCPTKLISNGNWR